MTPTKLPPWTKLPTAWIDEGGLRHFRWSADEGSNCEAALMAFTVILNHMERDTGITRLTYDDLTDMANLSRAKLAAGLDFLEAQKLVDRAPLGRSTYKVANHNVQSGWAKFPAKGLYSSGRVAAFTDFRLRRRAELDALKLYFLLAARRNNKTNAAHIGYDKLHRYSAVPNDRIRTALSLLINNGLIHTDRHISTINEKGFSNSYRLTHLSPRQHPGTTGRGLDPADIAEAEALQ